MAHTLTILFRRDASRDRLENNIPFEGYEILWPDGRPADVGLDAFCKHGQRLFGLGRHLQGRSERLMDLLCFHLSEREVDLTRLAGHRVRRFCLRRTGSQGRIHFLDGTPTAMVFDLERDEAKVLDWLGLPQLTDGKDLWIDVAARPNDADAAIVPTVTVAAPAVPYDATV
jgi:hypothetical protein